MASYSSLLCEEQVLCSICLEIFTEPVSIPCGHNFCKVCISNYWDTTDLCQCPLCKDTFHRRPDLRVNTAFRDVVDNVKKMKIGEEEECPAGPGEVPCDVCTGRKLKARRSCLVCLASYCETHLEPHQRVAAFKKHKLVRPVENLEDRMCKEHDKLLELFCKEDQTCVCLMCMNTDHKSHNVIPLEDECRQRKATLAKVMADIDQMVKTKSTNIQQIKNSVKINKRATAKQACLIKEQEMEIAELKRQSSEMKKLSHTDDHLHLLENVPSLSTLADHVRSDMTEDMTEMMTSLSQLKDKQMWEMFDVMLGKIKQLYAVDLTLDPFTAHPNCILSMDMKQVRINHLPDNPQRFDHDFLRERCASGVVVLAKQSFSSGRFYYEVQVGGKTGWVIGVARKSIHKKGKNQFRYTEFIVAVCLKGKRKIGVLVDYEEGMVSFYSLGSRSHVYTYSGCSFTEKLYPFFSPVLIKDKYSPLIITPITMDESRVKQYCTKRYLIPLLCLFFIVLYYYIFEHGARKA